MENPETQHRKMAADVTIRLEYEEDGIVDDASLLEAAVKQITPPPGFKVVATKIVHAEVNDDGKTLLQRHDEYIARLVTSGGGRRLLAYPTPCCQKLLHIPRPPKKELWTSMAVCPHCATMYHYWATYYQVSTRM